MQIKCENTLPDFDDIIVFHLRWGKQIEAVMTLSKYLQQNQITIKGMMLRFAKLIPPPASSNNSDALISYLNRQREREFQPK